MEASALPASVLPSELDAAPVAKRIGLIALATDHTSELDFARICDPAADGAAPHGCRVADFTGRDTRCRGLWLHGGERGTRR